MNRLLGLVIGLATCAGLGCGDATGVSVDRLRLEGTVSALGGGPIADAVLILQFPQGQGLGSRAATTNAEGRYGLTFAPGGLITDCREFALSASAAGFEPGFEGEIECTTDVQVFDFELRPTGS